MYGFPDEIELARELKACEDIDRQWPHLVVAHIDSRHPDIRDRLRIRWQGRYAAQAQAHELQGMMARAMQNAHPHWDYPPVRPYCMYEPPERGGILSVLGL